MGPCCRNDGTNVGSERECEGKGRELVIGKASVSTTVFKYVLFCEKESSRMELISFFLLHHTTFILPAAA